MTVLAELVDHVIGVDPDRDRVTAAVVSVTTQAELGSATFPATRRGYGQALRWAKTFTMDERRAWAIESTGSYGAGLAATLAERGEFVIEFDHPSTHPALDPARPGQRPPGTPSETVRHDDTLPGRPRTSQISCHQSLHQTPRTSATPISSPTAKG